MEVTLSQEQLQRIEENKRKALELRKSKLLQQQSIVSKEPSVKKDFKDGSCALEKPLAGSNTFNKPTDIHNCISPNLSQFHVPFPKTQNSSSFTQTLKRVSSSFLPVQSTKRMALQTQLSCSKMQNKQDPLNDQFKSRIDYQNFPVPTYGETDKTSENVVTGLAKLVSKDRFVIDAGYHKRMIDIFKTIKSAKYDAATKQWTFDIKDHDLLMSSLDAEKGLSVSKLPTTILKAFLKSTKPVNYDIDLSRIDEKLTECLMPFQREGVCYGISKNGRCLIADDMGLGKTIQALGIAHYYHDDWPLLIVSPSSVRYLWLQAIHNWLPSVPLHYIEVMNTSNDYIGDAKVVIVSYDLLARQKILNSFRFGMVILDESHFLKNIKTARTKAALAICRQAKRVLLLSGTPALSRPIELYTQIVAIQNNYFPSFQSYGIRYCAGKQTRWGWDFTGSSNMEELQLLLEHLFMIRRLKSDVITQLPSKIRQVVVLNSAAVLNKSNEMKSWIKTLDSKHLTGMERRGALLSFFAATGKAKLKAVKDYISDLLESGKKFICFVHHKYVMNGIEDILKEKEILYIKIDGTTSSSERQVLCDKFQFEDKYTVALLSITAANAGITLTAAKLVLFAELFWNPGILIQAEDRAHRIGQNDSVLVQYLIAKGTADDHLWPMIQEKLDVLNRAGLSKDNFLHSGTTVVKDRSQRTLEEYFEELNDNTDELLACAMEEIESNATKIK